VTRQLERSLRSFDDPPFDVDPQAPHPNDVIGHRSWGRSPQHCSHPRNDFTRAEGLYNVIVRPQS